MYFSIYIDNRRGIIECVEWLGDSFRGLFYIFSEHSRKAWTVEVWEKIEINQMESTQWSCLDPIRIIYMFRGFEIEIRRSDHTSSTDTHVYFLFEQGRYELVESCFLHPVHEVISIPSATYDDICIFDTCSRYSYVYTGNIGDFY